MIYSQAKLKLTVAIRFAQNLEIRCCSVYTPRGLIDEKYSRHHEEDQPVVEDQANYPRAILASVLAGDAQLESGKK